MEALASDLKFVLRSLRKSPLFVLVAVLSLGFGIGANSAIFSLLDQVLLRALPVKAPQQLVSFDWDGTFSGSVFGDHAFSYPMYRAFRDKTPRVFDGILARFGTWLDIGWKGVAERAQAEIVSGNYFDVLGVTTVLGRPLTPADDRLKSGGCALVLSYNYWQKRFGGSPAILNQTIEMNGHPMTVAGVAQRGFKGTMAGAPADVFVPISMKAQATPSWDHTEKRLSLWLNVIGRLKSGVTLKRAQAAATVVYHDELREDLKVNPDATPSFAARYVRDTLKLVPAGRGFSSIREQFSTPLIVLMAMVGTLLLICCGNVANLLIARAAGRKREIAVRLSVGAAHGAILRLMLVEALVLSLLGGVVALILSSWTSALLLRVLPFSTFEGVISTSPDLRLLLFTFLLCLLTAVIAGLTPALQMLTPDLINALKSEARSVAGGSGVNLRRALVAGQIALSLLLLIGAGLFARSLYNLFATSSGLAVDRLLTFSIDPSLSGYSRERTRQIFVDLQKKLAAVPGVLSVSGAQNPLLTGGHWSETTRVDGYPAKEKENLNPEVDAVLPAFFSTLQIPLLTGREFTEADVFGAPPVAIVNQSFVDYFLKGRSPLGVRIGFGDWRTAKLTMQIVGVVKDAKTDDLKQKPVRQVWIPALQFDNPDSLTFYVRSASEAGSLAASLRQVVRQSDPALPVYDVKSLAATIDETHYIDRLVSMLSAAFALLATLLAVIGLYGLIAFSVSRRTPELGIRIALGAQRGALLRLVMREVVILTGLGIGVALPVALALGKLIQQQLFGLKANDPAVMTVATLALAVVATLAGFLPARRATQIDPVRALGWE